MRLIPGRYGPEDRSGFGGVAAERQPVDHRRDQQNQPDSAGFSAFLAPGFGSFVGVNTYISPHRKDALDLHGDDHDLIVLQLHGSKLWTLGSRLVRGVASSKISQADQAATKTPAIERDQFKILETKAGDLLHLPRGLYHRATSNAPTSIHLPLGIRRPTGLDFVDLMIQ